MLEEIERLIKLEIRENQVINEFNNQFEQFLKENRNEKVPS